eukprot:2237791-Prymnesium_polylepis.1
MAASDRRAVRGAPSTLLVPGLVLLLQLIPLRAVMRSGCALGWIAHRLVGWRTRTLLANLNACSSSVGGSSAELASIASAAFEHVGRALLLSVQPRRRDVQLRRALHTEPGEQRRAPSRSLSPAL